MMNLPPVIGDCVIYEGHLRADGYAGRITRGGVKKPAYRWAYEDAHGPVPVGLDLDHLCNNRACVNPDHLDPVTNDENQRRRGLRQAECKNGHPRNDITSYEWNGWRCCRPCRAEAQARYEARKRAS